MHFRLLDPVGDAANLINNLHMKPGDKIATYNVEFMWYAAQLNWGDIVLCHRFYQGLPNRLQDLIANREQGKLSQKVTYLFCDELDIVSKSL